MSEFQERIFIVALDKFIFALIVAAFGFYVSRSIERLKSSLSWGAEVLRNRLSASKTLMAELCALQTAYDEAASAKAEKDTTDALDRLRTAGRSLERTLHEARLFLDEQTIKLVRAARENALRILSVEAPGASSPSGGSTGSEPPPSGLRPAAREDLVARRTDVANAITRALDAIRDDARIRESVLPPHRPGRIVGTDG